MAAAPRLRNLIYGCGEDVPFDDEPKWALKQRTCYGFAFRDFVSKLFFTYPEFWKIAEEYGKAHPTTGRGRGADYYCLARFRKHCWAIVNREGRTDNAAKIPGYHKTKKGKGFGPGTIQVALDAAAGGRS